MPQVRSSLTVSQSEFKAWVVQAIPSAKSWTKQEEELRTTFVHDVSGSYFSSRNRLLTVDPGNEEMACDDVLRERMASRSYGSPSTHRAEERSKRHTFAKRTVVDQVTRGYWCSTSNRISEVVIGATSHSERSRFTGQICESNKSERVCEPCARCN